MAARPGNRFYAKSNGKRWSVSVEWGGRKSRATAGTTTARRRGRLPRPIAFTTRRPINYFHESLAKVFPAAARIRLASRDTGLTPRSSSTVWGDVSNCLPERFLLWSSIVTPLEMRKVWDSVSPSRTLSFSEYFKVQMKFDVARPRRYDNHICFQRLLPHSYISRLWIKDSLRTQIYFHAKNIPRGCDLKTPRTKFMRGKHFRIPLLFCGWDYHFLSDRYFPRNFICSAEIRNEWKMCIEHDEIREYCKGNCACIQ